MEGHSDDWEDVVRRLAREIARLLVPDLVRELSRGLAYQLRRQLREEDFRWFRGLKNLSEKLVYRHLLDTQPDTFTGLRRTLDMDKKTLSRALKSLMGKGYVFQDDWNQYWIARDYR